MILASFYSFLKYKFFCFQVVAPLQRLLLATSHSGNLFIYCLSSEKFREILFNNIFKWCKLNQSDKTLTEMDTIVTQPLNEANVDTDTAENK